MSKKTIYLSEEIDEDCLDILRGKYNIVSDFSNPEDIEGIITRQVKITEEIIESCPKLKIISDHGTGTDQIDLEAARRHGVKVTNTPGLNAQSVAELTLCLMLSLSYRVKYIDSGLKNSRFVRLGQKDLIGNELSGKKVGFIGSGCIAVRLKNILKTSFDCKTYAYNPHRDSTYLREIGFIKIDNIEDIFTKMDYVTIHAPLTSETKNLINKEVLDKSNPNLFVINTSRGEIINEKDLYNALVDGKIRGAALDVFEKEPPSSDNPLFTLDNFIGTMHVGGSSKESLKRVGEATINNLINELEK